MVDEERVTRLLRRIARDVDHLAADASIAADPTAVLLDAVKYRFVTAIEGTANVAHHIIASEGWDAPDSNGEALTTLADRGVITTNIGAELRRAVGFRNVLVHGYIDVDDSIVIESLQRLEVFRAFVAQVAAWIDAA